VAVQTDCSKREQIRVLYFANCNNYHTRKWAAFFAGRGWDVHVASLEEPNKNSVGEINGVTVHWLFNSGNRLGSDLQKLGYLSTFGEARRLIESLNPDIVHAHYASSYGTVCAATCRRPFYLSVWGSDVYDFPRKGPLQRLLLKNALSKASWVMSTSAAMAEETRKYTDKDIYITPFGVDMALFNPSKRVPHDGLLVGTVKALEEKYGISALLEACAFVHDRRPDLGLKVRIAGTGAREAELRNQARRLGMDGYLEWLGFIPQEQAAREWASFDIALVPSKSKSESFGVSAVEAQASGTPLVISDVPGLMEACDGGNTALVVSRDDSSALAGAIERLADSPALRKSIAKRGLDYVRSVYEIGDCFETIEKIYAAHLE